MHNESKHVHSANYKIFIYIDSLTEKPPFGLTIQSMVLAPTIM